MTTEARQLIGQRVRWGGPIGNPYARARVGTIVAWLACDGVPTAVIEVDDGEFASRPVGAFRRHADGTVFCKRCARTEAEAYVPILGDVCGDCADDLREERKAEAMAS